MSAAATQAIIDALRQRGVDPTGIGANSRHIERGDVFVAWPGFSGDGRRHIADAVARGASAVLFENGDGFEAPVLTVPAIGVTGLRDHAAALAKHIYRNPSAALWLAGVTGTNGKTTVSQWIAAAQMALGERCGVIGTLGCGYPGEVGQALNTTPDVFALNRDLRNFVDARALGVAMEVSSIGLTQGRVDGLAFDVAVFTNLSRDHLDYHGDMATYADAKRRLFATPGLRYAVINADDAVGTVYARQARDVGAQVIAYTVGNAPIDCADESHVLRAQRQPGSAFGTHLRVHWRGEEGDLRARVVGEFNASNLLAVVGALLARGVAFSAALVAASRLEPPLGRMQLFGGVGEPLVVVDYAHSPDALAKLLDTCRDTARGRGGALVCVFGCGGDRDPGKRPLMGEAVRQRTDRVVITSDNPRHEDPQVIIDAIRVGTGSATGVEVIADRAAAIAHAIATAAADDVVVLAGKGHETYQEIRGQRLSFSDAEHAAVALRRWSSDKEGYGA